MSRLEHESPPLASILARLSPEALNSLVAEACARAVEATGVQDPLIGPALDRIRVGQDDALLALELARLEERLDEAHFRSKEAEGDASDTPPGSEALFRQARAVGAVRLSLEPASSPRAFDAVYEAAHAHGDPHDLYRVLVQTFQ